MAKVLGFTIQIQGTRAAIENATDLKLAISEINKALKETTDPKEYQKLEKELIRLKGAQKEVNAQIRDQIKAQQANLDVAEDSVGAYRRLSAELITARTRYKDLAAAGKENTEEAKALIAQVTTLDKRLKDIDGSVGQFQRNVGDYENAIKRAIPGLGEFADGLDNIKAQATTTGKVLATGFLAFEVISRILQGAQAIKEFADEFREFRTEVNRQTGALGEDLSDAAARSQAIAQTYGEDAKEVIRAANAVANEFDISLADALDKTAIAFREGANNSNELLDSLREYSSQVGDVDALFQILTRAGQEGIYSDKGIDAVKEFGIRIREQTTATRAALENAFGTEFTDELFGNLNAGSITTTEALAQVAGGLRDVDLTAQQTQTVLADVFGGPGEDAGIRFIQLLADVDQGLIDVTTETDAYKVQQQELYDANLELAQAQDAVAAALEGSSAEFELLTTRVQTFLFEQARRLIEFFESLGPFVQGAGAALDQFVDNAKNGFGLLGETASVGRAFTDAYKDARAEIRAVNEEVKRQNEQLRESKQAAAALRRATGQRSTRSRSSSGSSSNRAQVVEQENREVLAAERRAAAERLLLTSELATRAIQSVESGEEQKTDVILKAIEDRANKVREAMRSQQEIEQQALQEGIKQLGTTLLDSGFQVLEAFSSRAAEQRITTLDQEIEAQGRFIDQLEGQASRAGKVQQERLNLQIQQERTALERRVEDRDQAQRDLARREKRIAVIQTIIQTALAVDRALANPPGPPFSIPQAIAAGIAGAAQTAIIAAQPLATGGVVGSTVTGQPIRTLSNGDNVLATLRRGEVVLNSRQQEILGGASTFRAAGVPGFAGGGVAGAPITAPRVALSSGQDFKDLITEVRGLREDMNTTTEATNARIDRLRAYVVTEDIVSDVDEGEQLRINATLQ